MRARGLKPSLFKNEILGAADPIYSLIFEGLWCLADREGRLEDRPLRIHVEINPYRDSASTVQALDWLVLQGFVIRYESGGAKFLAVANFRKHQQPHIKEPPSKIPPPENQSVVEAPDEHGASTVPARLTPSSLTADSGLLTADTSPPARAREKPPKVPREAPPDWFLDFKLAYPERAGDPGWRKAQRAANARLAEGHTTAEFLAGAPELSRAAAAAMRCAPAVVVSVVIALGANDARIMSQEQPQPLGLEEPLTHLDSQPLRSPSSSFPVIVVHRGEVVAASSARRRRCDT